MNPRETNINRWIEQNRDREDVLMEWVKRMPKGGDLHQHFDGSLLTENLISSAVEQGLWVCMDDFSVSRQPQVEKQWKHLPELFQSADWENILECLLRAWSIKDFDATRNAADEHFFGIFPKFFDVIPGYTEDGLLETKNRCLEEKVNYLETHFENFPAQIENQFLAEISKNWSIMAAWENDLTHEFEAAFQQLQTTNNRSLVENTCNRIQEVHQRLNIDDDRFTLRYLMYVLRLLPEHLVFEQMYLAFLSCEISELLVGINLVGAENHPITQSDLKLHLQMVSFFKKKFPKVSVALHAGELTRELTERFLHPHTISQSVKAGAQRIGHGVAIEWEWNEEETLKIMREQRIPLEINLGSNEFILGIKPEEHPWRRYLKAGVPLVFGSDDLGILRSDRNREVTRFFSQYGGTYSEFKDMALNGILYSFLKDKDYKNQILNRLKADFDTFEKTFEDECTR